MNTASKFKSSIALALVLLLQACGSSPTETKVVETKSETKPAPFVLPPGLNPGVKVELEVEGFAVIRELGSSQTAALFGLKPNQGTLELIDVTGPAFLKVAFHRELNAASAPLLFKYLSTPMSEPERSALVADHQGSIVIYFEKYDGSLCLGQDNESKIVVSGKVDGKPFKTSFIFEASPTKDGDCKFHYLNVMTES